VTLLALTLHVYFKVLVDFYDSTVPCIVDFTAHFVI